MAPIPLELKVYERIELIREAEWNSINSSADVFHDYAFLKVVEESKVENSKIWYLMFYRGERLIGTAVLSLFIVNLDVFIGANGFITLIRKLWPGFLKIKMLICGIPASLGQKNIVVNEKHLIPECLDGLSAFMDSLSKIEKVRYLAFKEFKAGEVDQFGRLLKKGYFKAFSLPYMKLEIRWNDFGSYLKSLRHGYKRQVLASLEKINFGPEFSLANINEVDKIEGPALAVVNADVCTPDLFYDAYMEVMRRSASKLETFNAEFFRRFFLEYKDILVFIVLKDTTTIYGSAILVPHENELTFALIGKHEVRDEHDTYFNLITAIVKYAIDHKFSAVNMGQTSYYPKQRVGATGVDEYIFFKSRNRIMHLLLSLLKGVVFPELKLENLRVFSNGDSVGKKKVSYSQAPSR